VADTQQQMKARIAERLGVSIDEVPDSAIEKEMEESGALAKLKNQAKLTGVNPAETPLVQIPGLAEISAPKAPASPEKSVQAAISTAAAPTKSPDEAVKKVDAVVDEQAKFKQLQNMYASMSPTGNLSDKQIAAISKKYETESANIASELAVAKQEYKAGKDRLENAALIDSLGKGLAQLMAGLYGVNTGRDAVTGVDFKPKDWSSSFALLQRDYSQRASELKDARKESESGKEKALSLAERQSARTAQESGTAARFALQDIGQEKKQAEAESRAEQKQTASETKEVAKKKQAQDNLVSQARAEIEGLKQVLRTGDSKTRKKQEEVTAEALGKAGISSAKTAAVLEDYRGGIFSKDKPELLDTLLEDVSPAAAAPSGTVTVIDKATGKSKQFPANSKEVINARKNPAFEVK
jgi:hypothetical protein